MSLTLTLVEFLMKMMIGKHATAVTLKLGTNVRKMFPQMRFLQWFLKRS